MASPYEYEALEPGEVRILTVTAGNFGEPIVVRLSHYKLSDAELRLKNQIRSHGGERREEAHETDVEDYEENTHPAGLESLVLDNVSASSQTEHYYSEEGDSSTSEHHLQPDESTSHSNEDSSWDSVSDSKGSSGEDVLHYAEDSFGLFFDGQDPGYEALSYAWGSKVRSHRLQCTDASYFEVTGSLYTALQYLRYRDRERRIWADAVCINQFNLEERASQVAIMANIYQSAFSVVVWLGEAQSTDYIAFALLHACKTTYWEQYADEGSDDDENSYVDALMDEPWCPCCKELIPESELETITYDGRKRVDYLWRTAVDNVFKRPWFTRLWVYQEAACAMSIEVFCGFHHLPWDTFCLQRPMIYVFSSSEFDLINMYRDATLQSFDPCAFIRLLVALGGKDCEEDQDRVFAMRSIAKAEHIESLRPDYSITPTALYRRSMLECLADDNLDYLNPHRLTKRFNEDDQDTWPLPHAFLLFAFAGTYSADEADEPSRPSWTPAFNHLTARSAAKYREYSWSLGPSYLRHERYTKAPLKAKTMVRFSPDIPEILEVRGLPLGNIMEILENSSSPFAFANNSNLYAEWNASQEPELEKWISLCADFVFSSDYMEAKSFQEMMYCCSTTSGSDDKDYGWIMTPSRRSGKYNLFQFEHFLEDRMRSLRYYDHHRNLARIASADNQNRYGWIPQSAQVGDPVSMFVGCPRPFALSRQEDGTFKLLGDCWIMGVADSDSLHIPEDTQEWLSLS